MIVPQPRLLLSFAVVALPLAFAGAAWPEATRGCLAGALCFAILAAVDALRGARRLDGVTVKVPEVLRLSKDRAGALELRVRNPGGRKRDLRLAPAWPADVVASDADRLVVLPADAEWACLNWPCTGVRRGRHRLAQVWLEAVSPFGFWATRRSAAAACEFRVYPNLLADRRQRQIEEL